MLNKGGKLCFTAISYVLHVNDFIVSLVRTKNLKHRKAQPPKIMTTQQEILFAGTNFVIEDTFLKLSRFRAGH